MAILAKGVSDNYVSEKALIVASKMYFQHFAYIEWRIWVQNNNGLNKTCFFLNCCFSEKIQHTVKIDLFTDSKLVFRLCEIIKQKFEIDSASEPSAFYFEIRKAERQIGVDDVIYTDKSGIFHCL